MLFSGQAPIRRTLFPLVGRVRYLLEDMGPPLRQYWIASDKEELPFNRDERRWVYASAKGENKNFGFGTTEQLYRIGHPIIKQSTFPVASHTAKPFFQDPTGFVYTKNYGRISQTSKTFPSPVHHQYLCDEFWFSWREGGPSHGNGSKEWKCLSQYRRRRSKRSSQNLGSGSDLASGTGYYGARDNDGNFSLDVLCAEIESTPQILSD